MLLVPLCCGVVTTGGCVVCGDPIVLLGVGSNPIKKRRHYNHLFV